MTGKVSSNNNRFFTGGGEMGELVRAKDWSKTLLGNPETWPQSLHTSLNIILHSKFPMFIWWGPELICFYNDAYRPSLGQNGKHPSILGQRAEEAWLEIWDLIKPLIDEVLAGGEATWSEDQLIPIYRNGKIEDVYWTFSYSPIYDESIKPGGVLVTCNETTEKIITQRNLLENKDQLEFAIDSADLAAWDYNPATNKFTSNDRLKEWFGLPAETEIELSIAINAMAERDRPRVIEAIQQALDFSSGGKYDIEYTIVNARTKEERIVKAKGRAWFNNKKEAYRFNGILQDVTEETVARKLVEESEKRLNIVINATELGTWQLNLETEDVIYSNRYLEIFGYDSETTNVKHSDFIKHIYPEDVSIRAAALKRAMETGTLDFRCRLIWADQSIHWMEAKGKVFYNERNKPIRIMGTIRDITKEVSHQQVLLESEQKFRLLADSMPQHIWTGDAEGNLNYYNQSVFDYSGLTLEQIKKDGWLQIVHPDDRDENIRKWVNAVTTGEDFLLEHRFRRHDGTYRWQLSRAIPQRDDAGKIQMWVGTSTDIQDQKTFANELEKQVKERTRELGQKNNDLEKMNAELQSFAYVSSHDMQEPLRKIQTFASRILEKEINTLSENGKDYFRRMREAANRMQTLIEDLLAYSRTNNTERVFKNTDIGKIVGEVKSDFKELLIQKNGVIEIKETCKANIVPFQFRQVVHNLISNAIKFSVPEKPLRIEVKCELVKGSKLKIESFSPEKTYCHFSISDNGIGFDPQYKDRIFEVFQRLHARDVYSGTGIGLAIVKKIVDNHNGIITATGELNKGATFDIYFPA